MEQENKGTEVLEPQVGSEGFDAGMGDFENFEQDLEEVAKEGIDEFDVNMNYDKFVVLGKKELTNFVRLVEPLSKVAGDEYGKSVLIKSINVETVELRYINTPTVVKMTVPNKSQKEIDPFVISLVTLKKLVTNSYASLVFVQEDNETKLAVCGSLLYIETKPLDVNFYEWQDKETVLIIDKEIAAYVFKKVAAMLQQSERASEKVILVKSGSTVFNTGFFLAKAKSPFAEEVGDFVLWKVTADFIAALTDISKVSIKYKVEVDEPGKEKIVLSADDSIYAELQIGGPKRVEEFWNPNLENFLKSSTKTITIANDALYRLITLVGSLDYLSNIVTIEINDKEMKFTLFNQAMTIPSVYEFPIVEGEVDKPGEMKASAATLKSYLGLVGSDVKYSLTDVGLCVHNAMGEFILRKS